MVLRAASACGPGVASARSNALRNIACNSPLVLPMSVAMPGMVGFMLSSFLEAALCGLVGLSAARARSVNRHPQGRNTVEEPRVACRPTGLRND